MIPPHEYTSLSFNYMRSTMAISAMLFVSELLGYTYMLVKSKYTMSLTNTFVTQPLNCEDKTQKKAKLTKLPTHSYYHLLSTVLHYT